MKFIFYMIYKFVYDKLFLRKTIMFDLNFK
jgi:hypothetical protein